MPSTFWIFLRKVHSTYCMPFAKRAICIYLKYCTQYILNIFQYIIILVFREC